ncbi:MAG TPA: hypothetical protein VJM34_14740 [Novosphingobium sp.]|nr:hypothetical protein [Novosphingobium sp.]
MNIRRGVGRLSLWLAAATPAFAWSFTLGATPPVATRSAVFVEKQMPGRTRWLEPASALSRGDRVVTILSWQRLGNGEGDGFTITNPLPRVIAYQKSARSDEQVSVDGGRTWGRLSDLRIGSRVASPEDVTHVRWRIPADRAAQGRGQIAYSGIVR